MESQDERNSRRQGARDMWVAGLVITLSLVLSLVVAGLIVVIGRVRLF